MVGETSDWAEIAKTYESIACINAIRLLMPITPN